MKKVYVAIVLIGVLIAAAVAFFLAGDGMREEPPAVTAEQTAEEPATAQEPATDEAAAHQPAPPSFDVVRVNKGGDATIAGRGEPSAEITILDNGKELGRATADQRGEWVFVTVEPLTPGSHELSLRERLADGTEIDSKDVVVVSVAEGAGGKTLAVKLDKQGGKAAVLQGVEILAPGDLAIEAVDHDESGSFSISGRAKAGADVNVYVDNKFLAVARTGDDGHWTAADERARLTMERHIIRADQVDTLNRVVARVEAVFEPGAPISSKALTLAIVRPGNSLWRIARQIYGTGPRYTTIYEANKEQIRNPDLIYPGQIFELPGAVKPEGR